VGISGALYRSTGAPWAPCLEEEAYVKGWEV
jgi:hypothetical protein